MKTSLAVLAVCLLTSGVGTAQTLKVSLAEKIPPVVIDREQGAIPDMIREMNKLPGGARFETIGAFPFRRSLDNVVSGDADVHMPELVNPNVPEDSLPYGYSTATFFKVAFVLYTSKQNTSNIKDHLPDFRVYTLSGQSPFFKGVKGEMEIDAALKRLSDNQIDGFIGPMAETDAALKKAGFTNIARKLIGVFDVRGVIAKGEKGKQVDKSFSAAIEALRANGTLEKIFPESVFSKFTE